MEPLVRFDWAIKNILRNKANFDILEGFLSALLKVIEKKKQTNSIALICWWRIAGVN
jgi:hypothetical protein